MCVVSIAKQIQLRTTLLRNKQIHLMGLSCWFGLVVLHTVTEVVISM